MEHRLVREIENALDWNGPEHLGREFARGSLADPELCPRLLTPTRLLDLVMRRSMAPHRLRCLVGGEDVHPQHYITNDTARRGYSVPVANMRRIGQLIESGCTLIVDQTNTYDPTMEIACRALQWWAREHVQVNTYLTTGESSGFDLHWDDHDVIIVQLAGSKSWEVRGLSRPAPMYRDAVANPDPTDEIVWSGTMHPGDVMHIPRGYWHRATRQDRGDGYSLHVTFGFPQRTGVDWFSWLADESRTLELFRHDLNRFATAEERARQQQTLTDAAAEMVTKASLSDYLTSREDQRPPARHVATHGVFGEPSDVVCITEFPPTVATSGDTVTVSAVGKTITLSAKALPVVSVLLSGAPVNVASLAASTGIDAATVADVLVTEEICAEVTPELHAGFAGLVTLPDMPEAA